MNPWDERFGGEAYAYGTEPSRWLVENAGRIPRGMPVLALGEGEGRNGVFLAGLGLDVEAVDGSPVGLAKARRLASSRGVPLRTTVADLADFVPAPGGYGAVVLVFLHLPPPSAPRSTPAPPPRWLREAWSSSRPSRPGNSPSPAGVPGRRTCSTTP